MIINDKSKSLTEPVNVLSEDEILISDPEGMVEGGGGDPASMLAEANAQGGQEVIPPMINQGFYDNLVPMIDPTEVTALGEKMYELVEADKEDRKEFMEKSYNKSIKALDDDGGVLDGKTGESTPSQRRLSTVKQTLLSEGITHFNARALAEILPPAGAVRVAIVGSGSDELTQQSNIVRDFMNYQVDHNIDGYFETIDKLLMHIALTGSGFIKTCWHPVKQKVDVQFIDVEHMIVCPESKNLYSSQRFTHEIRITSNEFNQLVASGYYSDIARVESYHDDGRSVSMEVEGVQVSSDLEEGDMMMSLYEIYTYYRFESIDNDGIPIEIEIPYIITIHTESHEVVSIRRNWDAYDPMMNPLQHIVDYTFMPGLEFYGRGLYDYIGGLDKAATGALRYLLDAGSFANSVTGFKKKGADGGAKSLKPGEMREVPGGSTALNQDILPIQFKEPSPSMFQLLGFLTEEGRRFAMTTDFNVGELSSHGNLPVGTVTALIEQGQKQFSAIHKRLHRSQARQFAIMVRLYRDNMEDQVEFTSEGNTQVILRQYFDDRIDIVPVSDPNISSSTQRIVMAQELLTIAAQFPNIINTHEAVNRMLQAMNTPNPEELLIQQEEVPLLDPVTENERAMKHMPIQTYPGQDHAAHIQTHIAFMEDPNLGASPFGQQALIALESHVRDHIAAYYKERAFATLNVPIQEGVPLDPETERQLSQQFARLTAETAIEVIPALQNMSVDPSIQKAIELAELEMEIKKANADQDLIDRRDKLKAELDAMRVKSEAQADIDVANNSVKISQLNDLHQQELRHNQEQFNQQLLDKDTETEQKIKSAEEQNNQKLLEKDEQHEQALQQSADKARQESQQQHEKHVQELKEDHEKAMQELNDKIKKNEAEIEALKKKADSIVKPPKKD